jgi:sulfiredoxin
MTDTNATACIPPELKDAAAEAAAAAPASAPTQHATSSVFSRDADAPVHVVPMRVIHRPLPSELDEDKVQAFMEEMKVGYSVCGS